MSTHSQKSREDKTQGVPSTSKCRGTCLPIHPRIYAHASAEREVREGKGQNLATLRAWHYWLHNRAQFASQLIKCLDTRYILRVTNFNLRHVQSCR